MVLCADTSALSRMMGRVFMARGHWREYKRARRRFMVPFYVVAIAVIVLVGWMTNTRLEGWWLLALCAGVVLVELFFWINIGLPRAVRRGSNEFKRAYYYGPEEDG